MSEDQPASPRPKPDRTNGRTNGRSNGNRPQVRSGLAQRRNPLRIFIGEIGASLRKLVFGDPLAITLPDPYPNEQRWRTIGKPSAQVAVLIIRGSYVAGGK